MKPYNQWFYSNMEIFINENGKKIKCWLYGHTHFNNINNQLKYNNTTLISNQVGYSKEYLRNYNKFFYFI